MIFGDPVQDISAVGLLTVAWLTYRAAKITKATETKLEETNSKIDTATKKLADVHKLVNGKSKGPE